MVGTILLELLNSALAFLILRGLQSYLRDLPTQLSALQTFASLSQPFSDKFSLLRQ